MIEDLNADAVDVRRIETFTAEDEKYWMQFNQDGNQIKFYGDNLNSYFLEYQDACGKWIQFTTLYYLPSA